MSVYGFDGKFGAGKSAFCSLLAVNEARRGSRELWANYTIHGGFELRTIADLYAAEGAVVVIDEAYLVADSRSSTGKANAAFDTWLGQCRKQDIDLFVIFQQLHKVDKRLRENIDILFSLRNLGGHTSAVTVWDMDRMRKLASYEWDRRPAYGLYDTRQRAWGLDVGAAEPRDAGGVARGSQQRAASSSVRS